MSAKRKLSEEQVRDIRQRLGIETGVSLAQEYLVHPSTITAIKQGRTWKKVTKEPR